MSFVRRLTAFAVGALAVVGCQREKAATNAAAAGALTDADRDSIRAYVARFDRTILAGDWPAAVAFYSEDAVLLPPNAPEIKGRDAIRKFFEGFPKFTEFKQQVEEIEGDAKLAYPRGTFESVQVPPGGKNPVKNNGKVLAVWHKQADGSWLVDRVIWNSDLPAATR
jgi:uncharacterized protein (TIGR02246 family)